jgi:glucokinase
MKNVGSELVLAGDIGGTKADLALFSVHGEKLLIESQRVFPSKKYSGLVPVLEEFLGGKRPPVDAACFGIAGAVVDGKVTTPNLPWMIDIEDVRRLLKLDAVTLLNDLEAAAYGIFTLENDEFYTLNEGAMRHAGNKALIAAGTGLGQAILFDDGRRFRPLASEAGHADFAPRSELEIELLRHLMGRFGHVSYERVVSGPGLLNIYRFLRDVRGVEEPPWLSERLAAADDPSAEISKAALKGEAEIAGAALTLFVSAYGPWRLCRRRHRAEDPRQAQGRDLLARLRRQGPLYRSFESDARARGTERTGSAARRRPLRRLPFR